MKISSSQMFRKFNKWSLSLSFMVLLSGTVFAAGAGDASEGGDATATEEKIDGGALFALKCATCHSPHKQSTGPKLYGVRSAWEEGGAGDMIYTWVRNWQDAVNQNSYAAGVAKKMPTNMNQFPDLSDAQIDAILDWVDAQPLPGEGGGDNGGASTGPVEEDNSSSFWIWMILGIVFVAVILAVGGVRRQLQIATGERSGEEGLSYIEEIKAWLWKYKRYMSLVGLVTVLAVIVVLFQSLDSINVMEDYHPDQPIAFPHDIHAGKNGIDCKYCHNSVEKSKTAGIPSVNVCMNCHKKITGNDDRQKAEIQKIYDAAGWDGTVYTGKTKPIIWNKVHNLPDHVFFSHKQHVKVGGVDCAQCHGDMTKRNATAKVMPVAELNEIDGNIKLSRPTLTMGWCIECHDQKEISNGVLADDNKDQHSYYDEIHKRLLNNDKALYSKYLEDGKVTVKELGGWECSKCHY